MSDVVSSGLLESIAHCVDSGESLLLDDFTYDSGSRIRRYEIRAVRVGPDHLSFTWRDINDRYEVARRVAQSEERYRLLAENSSDVVAHFRDNEIVWVSPSIEDSLGAPPSFWIGRPIGSFAVAEDLSVIAEILEHTAAGESVVRRLRVRDANGQQHWIELHAKLFYDGKGNADGRTASLRVIDSEIASEQALEHARAEQARADARYRKLIEHSVVATCINSPRGRSTMVNQAMCDFFGYDEDTLLAMRWRDLASPECLQQDMAAYADILAGRRDSYRSATQYTHADGHPIWGDLSVSCYPRPGRRGGIHDFPDRGHHCGHAGPRAIAR